MFYKFTLTFVISFLPIILHANTPLKIASYNIRNYGMVDNATTLTNKSALKSIIRKTGADLISVQEIVNTSDFKQLIVKSFSKYRVRLSACGGRGKQKLGFIYNYKRLTLLNLKEDNRIKSKKGCEEGLRPILIARFKDKVTGKVFYAMAIHLKAGGNPKNIEKRYKQIKILSTIISEYKRKNPRLVLIGDFNTTEYKLRNNYYDKFVKFVDQNNMYDFSSEVSCSSYWWGGIDDGVQYPSLLDHILITKEFKKLFKSPRARVKAHCAQSACSAQADEDLGVSFNEVSDHCPIVATLK